MAWESRRHDGASYYYRGRRGPDGRVYKLYFGHGAAAVAAAEEDADIRAKRQADRAAAKALMSEKRSMDELHDTIDTTINLLVDAVLAVNGFRAHKGQFRRRRSRHGCHTPNNDSESKTRAQARS